MTDNATTKAPIHAKPRGGGFPLGAWVRANAVGLGVAYGLFALLGDAVEHWGGAPHDSIARNAAIMSALLIGAAVFVLMRRNVLAPHLGGAGRTAVAAGVGLAVGLTTGFMVAGPPFDFVFGVATLGTIGGALQWRLVKDRLSRPGGLFLAGAAAWLAAAVAVLAVALFAGDLIFAALGQPDDASAVGFMSYVAFLTLLGVVGGAVGGAIEGAALRRRMDHATP
ncbi:MAG TPA: hypothetical protein VFA46_05045 [Actinomycetes bacterium]|jgi:uncharacterized membrane protein|nr:hypothetical protein [Actinomycetes bacterium]